MKKISLFILFSLLYVSCSQNVNNILNVNYSLILDYNELTKNQNPNQRLSVFIQSTGEIRRFDSMKLYSSVQNYEWNVSDLIMLETSNGNFSGYSNFIVPQGQNIPQGNYQINMINADGTENVSTFSLNFDDSIFEKDISALSSYFSENSALVYISIYDENQKIIYFGEKTEKLSTPRDIWLSNNNSEFYYDIYFLQDKHLMCIMPKKQIQNGDKDE